ncbi:MAG TPA: ornithine cyclodeaminase family protein [Candidatus Bathyarchaeia archaeon]|nr:ornithine cyclodeaminase family protein [Candidatus Bathyarchaeia archaeon]
MTVRSGSGVRFLSAADVTAAMPPIEERLHLAERTMTALADGSGELPPKTGVHPRPDGSFAHAMPAHLRGADTTAIDDLLGIKWIAGFPANRVAGLPAIHGLVLLSDPATGAPTAILDAGPITAQRTAAVSGVAIRLFTPSVVGRPARAAILGAGVQGRSHLAVVGHLIPGVELTVFDRHPDRAAALVAEAKSVAGIGRAGVAGTAIEATRSADVVITAASFTAPTDRQVLTDDWLARHSLVVAVDYATYVAASVARSAALFVTDQREQFLANREAGNFDGYPDPTLTLGEAILARTPRPARGRVVVSHLGVGLADLVFGGAILRRAEAAGLGAILPA